jgi:drug/metabolite transporter (DMT)-like permease
MIGSLFSSLYALRSVPLNIAWNLGGVAYVIVPLLSWGFLHDHISLQRWLGIAMVALGVVVTAREAVRLEEKL